MIKNICNFVFHKLMGWKSYVSVPYFDKCIYCVAPHTSNLDLFIGKLFITAAGRKGGFVMKKEWFVGPLDHIFRHWMGGIPVNRGNGTALITELIDIANSSQYFRLALTPEGTRKANPKWHLGFYVLASKANLPIVLMGMDYKKKEIHMEKYIMPSDDRKADLREIYSYYEGYQGRHPENFVIPKL